MSLQAQWIEKWVNRCVKRTVIAKLGLDEVVSEAWLFVVRAATSWRPDCGSSFRTYAMTSVKDYLPLYLWRKAQAKSHKRLWTQMPHFNDDGGPFSTVLPSRSAPARVDPILSYWCSPEARSRRRYLSWRQRIVLYLRYVERLQLQEVGDAFGISRERVRQVQEGAIACVRKTARGGGEKAKN